MKGIITTQEIRLAHPGLSACATDPYYTRFANQLFDRLRTFVGKDIPDKNFTRTLARKLTCYFEDVVADMGVWRAFSDKCMQLYGHPVPMYHADEDYYPDEPSLDAVRYLIWDVANDLFPDRIFETDRLLADMGQEAYRILSDAFEHAPINEEAKKSMDDMLHYATEGFNELRSVLDWMIAGCYITAGSWLSKALAEKSKQLRDIGLFDGLAPSMREYFIISDIKFYDQVGPLALKPYEWLRQIAASTGHDDIATALADIDTLPLGTYRFADPDADPLTLDSTLGRSIQVSRSELNIDAEVLRQHNCLYAGFVYYLGAWHLNGLLVPLKLTDEDWEKSRAADSATSGTTTMSADTLLERTGGRRLVYFKDANEMKAYLHDTLKISEQAYADSVLSKFQTPCMFIDTEDKTDPQYFAQNIEKCIKDPDNPYYDAEQAKDEAINILWNANGATTAMVNYLVSHDLLPDAEHHFAFSQHSTHQQRLADMNFYMRYNRRNQY